MSRMNKDQFDILESESRSAFQSMRNAELEPSPFMKSRILARLEEKKSVGWREAWSNAWVWRAVSAVAITACAVLIITRTQDTTNSNQGQVYALQPYVIHLDLGGEGLRDAQIAEVELPDGVKFVSKAHPEISELRKLQLPVPDSSTGRSRLPFVVRADRVGVQDLKLKILNEKNEVIEERVLSVNFADTTKGAEIL